MKHRLFIITVILLFLFPLTLQALTLDEEKKYGKEVYFEITKSATLNNDPYLAFYLKTIKDRLESVVSLPFPIVLTILESQSPNAFATLGGYVYITTGLIALCDREEELAGVLAHEFAHIGRRHIAKRLEKQKFINVGVLATMLLSMAVGDSRAKEAIMTTGAASASALSLKYSREDEDEADRAGSQNADKAGYGGLGTAEFLKKLRATGGDKTLPQYLLTHPYHDERIIKIENQWAGSKVTVKTDFFPFLLVRVKIIHKPMGAPLDDTWVSRYLKDKNDPVNAYAASLIYSLKGNMNEAVDIVTAIRSPFKNMFMGELLVSARRFSEAIMALKDQTSSLSRYYLALAYEGTGNYQMAADTLRDLSRYGSTYPELYQKLGMIVGRMGYEAQGFEYLGRYHYEMGRLGAARTNFEKAINRYGINSREARELLKILEEMKEPR